MLQWEIDEISKETDVFHKQYFSGWRRMPEKGPITEGWAATIENLSLVGWKFGLKNYPVVRGIAYFLSHEISTIPEPGMNGMEKAVVFITTGEMLGISIKKLEVFHTC